MVMLNTQINENGVYRCQLNYNNTQDELFSDIRLVVTDLTAITASQNTFNVFEGSDVTISLDIKGTPIPVIKWYHKNLPYDVNNADTITTIKNDGDNTVYRSTLRLTNVAYAEHEGEYEIRLEFPGATAKSLQKFQVNVKYGPGTSTQLTQSTNSNIIKNGDSVTLTCSASSFPASTYTIYKDGDSVSTTGEYKIASMSFANEANYSCEATNEVGTGTRKTLEIIYGVPPLFTSQNTSEDIATGQNQDFTFIVKGKPRPQIAFTFKGFPLQRSFKNSETATVDEEGVVFVLVTLSLEDIQPNDRGMFGCIAINPIGEALGTTDLNVLYALQFDTTKNQDRINGIVGQQTIIPCHAIVNPGVVTYTWKHNGTVLENHQNVDVGNLTLPSVSVDNEGFYRCEAKSGGNTITHETFLSVTSIPTILNITESQQIQSGEFVDLKCHARGTPNPSYRWYRNASNILSTKTSFRFFAHDSDVGQNIFVCEARNSVGVEKRYTTISVINPAATVSGEYAHWLIPLLIGLSLLVLLVLFAFFIRKKWQSSFAKKDPPSPKIVEEKIYNDDVTPPKEIRNKDKLTLNPVFQDDEDTVDSMYPVYLPRDFESNNMQVLSIQRFQGEHLPWPGADEDGKEEMTVEMKLGEEENDYERVDELCVEQVNAHINSAFENDESLSTVSNNQAREDTDSIILDINSGDEQETQIGAQSETSSHSDVNEYNGISSNGDIGNNVDQYVDDLFDFR